MKSILAKTALFGLVSSALLSIAMAAPIRVGIFKGTGQGRYWHTSMHTSASAIISMLAKPDAAWDKPAITQVRRANPGQQPVMGYSLRTERYRYSIWGWQGDATFGAELYDYKTDPRELRNLAGDHQSDPLRGRLHDQLTGILDTRRAKPA